MGTEYWTNMMIKAVKDNDKDLLKLLSEMLEKSYQKRIENILVTSNIDSEFVDIVNKNFWDLL